MIGSPKHHTPPDAGGSRLIQALEILIRRRWMIAAITAGVVVLAAAVLLILPKQYEAKAEILLEQLSDSEKAMLFRVNIPNIFDKFDWINSEMQIIRSVPVAERVLKEITLERFLGEELEGTVGEIEQLFRETVQVFREKLRVTRAGNSNVLIVAFESRDPVLSKDIVQSVVRHYKAWRREVFRETEAYEFYSRQLAEADERLRALESRQTEYKRAAALVEPKSQGALLLKKLGDYQASLNAVQTKRIGKEARLAIIEDQVNIAREFSVPATEISDSPSRADYLTKLRSDLLELELRRDELLHQYEPGYRDVVEIENRIRATEEKFLKEIQEIIEQEKTGIRVLKAQEEKLQKAMAAIRAEISRLSEKDYQLAQISRGIQDSREVYSMLLRQRENARLSMEKAERGVRVLTVSPPRVPVHHSRPQRRMAMVIALMAGLFLGITSAFVREFWQLYGHDREQDEASFPVRLASVMMEKPHQRKTGS